MTPRFVWAVCLRVAIMLQGQPTPRTTVHRQRTRPAALPELSNTFTLVATMEPISVPGAFACARSSSAHLR